MMVVRMVAKVRLDNMESEVLYPPEEQSFERIAILTGIVQLVSTALKRDDFSATISESPNYMKSEKGVVGYIQLDGRRSDRGDDGPRLRAEAHLVLQDQGKEALIEWRPTCRTILV